MLFEMSKRCKCDLLAALDVDSEIIVNCVHSCLEFACVLMIVQIIIVIIM